MYPNSAYHERELALTRDALAVARRVGESWALVQGLIARAEVLNPTDDRTEQLEIGAELVDVAGSGDDLRLADFELRDAEWVGHQSRHNGLLSRGDVEGADRELAELSRMADQRREPFQLFSVLAANFGRAHASGRFADAQHFIEEGKKIGTRLRQIQSFNFHEQSILLGRECGPALLPQFIREFLGSGFIDVSQLNRSIPVEVFGGRIPPAGNIVMTLNTLLHEQDPAWMARLSAVTGAHCCMQMGRKEDAAEILRLLGKRHLEDLAADGDALFLMKCCASAKRPDA